MYASTYLPILHHLNQSHSIYPCIEKKETNTVKSKTHTQRIPPIYLYPASHSVSQARIERRTWNSVLFKFLSLFMNQIKHFTIFLPRRLSPLCEAGSEYRAESYRADEIREILISRRFPTVIAQASVFTASDCSTAYCSKVLSDTVSLPGRPISRCPSVVTLRQHQFLHMPPSDADVSAVKDRQHHRRIQ